MPRVLPPFADLPAWPVAALVAVTAAVTSVVTASLIAVGLLAAGVAASGGPPEPAVTEAVQEPADDERLQRLPAHREVMTRIRRVDANLEAIREDAQTIPGMAADVSGVRDEIGALHGELRGRGDVLDRVDVRLGRALRLLERATESVENMDDKTGPNPRGPLR